MQLGNGEQIEANESERYSGSTWLKSSAAMQGGVARFTKSTLDDHVK